MKWLASFILRLMINIYRKILSPLYPPMCRYKPTCSIYALEAISKYGPWKGAILSIKRILKCHPWGDSGHDPVP